jgi:predicted ATPase
VDRVVTNQVVTVVGPGGIGKSRLAIEGARSIVPRFPDGVFYVDLASVPNADLAAAGLLDVMGLPEAGATPLETLKVSLRDRDVLIVLDTADRVAGVGGLVAALAGACPHVRMLVTSRAPLRIAAERELTIGPLPARDAVELFEARARAVSPRWEADSFRPAVERLAERLDGIPLAIELAASRTRLLTPAAILERLERRLPTLGTGPADLPDRQRTLEATIAWSHEQLEPADQGFFARLGAFVGAFDLDAVEAVATEPGEDALGSLERLVDRSLVTTESSSNEPAFRLLGPIRDFAAAALLRGGGEHAVRERHAAHYLALVERQAEALESPDDLAAVTAIERAEPELRGALDWTLRQGRAETAIELAGRLGRYWWVTGRIREGLDWLERALAPDVASDPSIDRAALARAMYWSGVLLEGAERLDEARARLEEALALQGDLGDERAVARTLNSLGVVARSQGRLDEAAELFSDSLERKRRLGDDAGLGVSLSNLGVVANDRGDLPGAVELLSQALAADERTGSASAVTVSCANLGSALIRAGRIEQGLDQIRRSLPGIAELRDPELVAGVLTSLGHVQLASADPEAARHAARLTLAADALRQREGVWLRLAERREVDDLVARELGLLGPDEIAAIRAEAGVTDLDAALRLAEEAAR